MTYISRRLKVEPSDLRSVLEFLKSNLIALVSFLYFEFIRMTVFNKIIQFQVHNSTAYHLYTELYAHHLKSVLCPSPFISSYPHASPFPPPPSIVV